jgi:tRNA (adenine37-N6)-methyltransferase
MRITMAPIGYFYTDEIEIPRHWSISDEKGRIEIDSQYAQGLKDIRVGQKIVVIFYFHKSEPFTADLLVQTPPHKGRRTGVFSICSPMRPNPLGLSVLSVVGIRDNVIDVNHIDMVDGTPILDIKPHIVP